MSLARIGRAFRAVAHMAELIVKGPGAKKPWSLACGQRLCQLQAEPSKQFVPCSYDGYVINDGILVYLGENELDVVGRELEPVGARLTKSDSYSAGLKLS